jgi:hypothetical protein
MVFCCDPLEPLSTEEHQQSGELMKALGKAEAIPSRSSSKHAYENEGPTSELDELLVSGKCTISSNILS